MSASFEAPPTGGLLLLRHSMTQIRKTCKENVETWNPGSGLWRRDLLSPRFSGQRVQRRAGPVRAAADAVAVLRGPPSGRVLARPPRKRVRRPPRLHSGAPSSGVRSRRQRPQPNRRAWTGPRTMAGQGEKPRASPHPDRGYGASKDAVSRRRGPLLATLAGSTEIISPPLRRARSTGRRGRVREPWRWFARFFGMKEAAVRRSDG